MWSPFLPYLKAALLALPVFSSLGYAQRTVFAHFMHGLTSEYTESDWVNDISRAKQASIDGFALNIGPSDPWTEKQLDTAYSVAERNGFKLMISFDMLCCGPWDVTTVTSLINKYMKSSAYYSVGGKPFVSTFEGTDWISNWDTVRKNTGGIFLVPDWTSLGPSGFANHLDKVEGAFAWDAWPEGPNPKTTASDNSWKSAVGSKAYMAGVSPWFYTNLPSKNWLWKGDDLWFTRWEQMLTVLPDFVQIISWNDFGESHYIGPIVEKSVISGAQRYVDGLPHEGFRFSLPYYIAAYKAGTKNVPIRQEGFSFWYRRSPGNICSAGGTTCNNPAYQQTFPADQCLEDSIFVATLSNGNAAVEVIIGGQSSGKKQVTKGASLVKVPFSGRQGDVEVKLFKGYRQVAYAKGISIQNGCPADGIVNFNAWAGQATVNSIPRYIRSM